MTEPRITRKKITDYLPDEHNANRGTERGHRALDDSVNDVGLGRSVLADKNGKLVAGNKTHQAAVDNGFEDVLEVETDGNTLVVVKRTDFDLNDPNPDNKARRAAYYDNRVGQLSLDFDPAVLLADLNAGVNFDALFTKDELAELLAGMVQEEPAPDAGPQIDRAEELQKIWNVQRGDVWRIGKHRLMCGDSTSAEDVARLMDGVKMQGAFTSPPYAEQRKEQYGGIPADEYVAWWDAIQANVRAHLKDDGSFFVNIKPHSEDGERSLYVMDLVVTMSRQWRWSFVDEFCWLRSGVPRQVQYSFKNGFEPVYQFAATRKGFKFHPEAVMHESESVPIPGGKGVGNTNWAGKQGNKQHGKAASDLQGHSSWIFGGQEYAPGMAYPSNVLKGFSNDETRGHEAAFPVQLPSFFIKAYSDSGDIWYEPFCGSGTTLVACEQTGRIGYGMEISPEYCAVILQRLADMGLTPERVS